MPTTTDYHEAVQDPATAFADPALRAGAAATGPLGLPIVYSGNFADVYRIDAVGGKSFAVKCFTKDVKGRNERYRTVSAWLKNAGLPFLVDVDFQEQGILVCGGRHPIVKMPWVEGTPLNLFVRENLSKPDLLRSLLTLWRKLAGELERANIVHGDIQHGNVLLVPTAANTVRLTLVDYDGLVVPELAGKPTGESGHPHFQHPRRARDGHSGRAVDRFSHLAVCTALYALSTRGGPELWRRYNNDDNLLFRQTDFEKPRESRLFQELWSSADPDLTCLAGHLALAATGEWSDVAPLHLILDDRGRPQPLPADRRELAAQTFAQPKPRATPPPLPAHVAPIAPNPGNIEALLLTKKEPQPDADVAPLLRFFQQVRAKLASAAAVIKANRRAQLYLGACAVSLFALGLAGLIAGMRDKPSQMVSVSPMRQPIPFRATRRPDLVQASVICGGTAFGPRHVVFSPDGKSLANVAGEQIEIRDAQAGFPLRTVRPNHFVLGIAFSPDGTQLASVGKFVNSVTLWSVRDGARVGVLSCSPHFDSGLTSVAFSPDGVFVAATSGLSREVFVWTVASGKLFDEHKMSLPTGSVSFCSLGPTSFGVCSAPSDSSGLSIRSMSGVQAKQITDFPTTHVATSADGTRVACFGIRQGKPNVCVSDLSSENKRDFNISFMAGQGSAISVSPDGLTVAMGFGNNIALWDVPSGNELARLSESPYRIDSLAFSPDGKLLASTGQDSRLVLWKVDRLR